MTIEKLLFLTDNVHLTFSIFSGKLAGGISSKDQYFSYFYTSLTQITNSKEMSSAISGKKKRISANN